MFRNKLLFYFSNLFSAAHHIETVKLMTLKLNLSIKNIMYENKIKKTCSPTEHLHLRKTVKQYGVQKNQLT